MPDRNGTIKRLQDSLKVVNRWCRTDSLDDPIANVERAMEDALELLKGQEPLKPFRGNSGWACSACGNLFNYPQEYCDVCGRQVNWNA